MGDMPPGVCARESITRLPHIVFLIPSTLAPLPLFSFKSRAFRVDNKRVKNSLAMLNLSETCPVAVTVISKIKKKGGTSVKQEGMSVQA